MIKEFREFITKGNVLDLAVAVIIGAAFGAIITSLVNDIIMPLIGLLTGGLAFQNLFIALDGGTYATLADATEAGAATLKYGLFIQAIINFLIIAFAVFMLVRTANKIQKKEKKESAPPPGPSAEVKLLTEIRDLLSER